MFDRYQKVIRVLAVVIARLLPRDGGTARTAIQVHVVNLIDIRLGQWFSNFLRCDAFKKACETLRRTRQHPTV